MPLSASSTDNPNVTQGMYVQIYNNEVVVRGREFSNQTWIEYALQLGKYTNPEGEETVGTMILRALYEYMYEGQPEELYSFLHDHEKVDPTEILVIASVLES